MVTKATGTVLDDSDHYPFGGERLPAYVNTCAQNYKFTGKERDSESGLDYFEARYYSSGYGRFMSPDEFAGGPVDAFSASDPLPPGPLPYADISNPQSLNKYAYTYNNPLRYTDPDGHDGLDFVFGLVNSLANHVTLGAVPRFETSSPDTKAGQLLGDAIATVGGAASTATIVTGSLAADVGTGGLV